MGPGYQPSNETAGYPVFEPIGYIDQDGRLKVKHQNDGTMMYHVTMLHLENAWKAAVITYNYERFDRIFGAKLHRSLEGGALAPYPLWPQCHDI